MAKTHPSINKELKKWIEKQPMFFLASAPLQSDGHINLSPRGLDSLRIINENELLILDLTGSGNETAAHLYENRRMTVMLCAFDGEPRILRLYGHGTVIQKTNQAWQGYRGHFENDIPGVRQIFHLQVNRVQTSCGFGVPLMIFNQQRDQLTGWASKKGEHALLDYQLNNNAQSIDGLPAPGLSDKN